MPSFDVLLGINTDAQAIHCRVFLRAQHRSYMFNEVETHDHLIIVAVKTVSDTLDHASDGALANKSLTILILYSFNKFFYKKIAYIYVIKMKNHCSWPAGSLYCQNGEGGCSVI